jgi:DNA-binding CsgD family transcriptional regulator
MILSNKCPRFVHLKSESTARSRRSLVFRSLDVGSSERRWGSESSSTSPRAGGRVVAARRALAVPDYFAARLITHDCDEIIRAESLRAFAAAPVIVARRPVAVLYVALRTSQQEMGRLLDTVSDEACNLGEELAVAEVLRWLHDAAGDHDTREDWAHQARLHDAHARLRTIAAEVDDPALRTRLLETAALLTDDPAGTTTLVRLTDREKDVLALLSSGLSSQEIAGRLGIGVYTVKGHLKNLFVKLVASGRIEAVGNARRLGLIPESVSGRWLPRRRASTVPRCPNATGTAPARSSWA